MLACGQADAIMVDERGRVLVLDHKRVDKNLSPQAYVIGDKPWGVGVMEGCRANASLAHAHGIALEWEEARVQQLVAEQLGGAPPGCAARSHVMDSYLLG